MNTEKLIDIIDNKYLVFEQTNKVCLSCKEFDGYFCKKDHYRVDQLMVVDDCTEINI